MESAAGRRDPQRALADLERADREQHHAARREHLPDEEQELIEGELRLRHRLLLLRLARLREERGRIVRLRWRHLAHDRAVLLDPGASRDHVPGTDGEEEHAGDDESAARRMVEERRFHPPGHGIWDLAGLSEAVK